MDDTLLEACETGAEVASVVSSESASALDDMLQSVYKLRIEGISEEGFLIATTSLLMFFMFTYVLSWIVKRPRPFLAGLALWIVWFLWAVVYQQKIGFDEIYLRWRVACEATQRVFPDIYYALSAWCNLLTPFLYDFGSLALAVNNTLSWIQRAMLAFACLSVYSVARSIRAFRQHRDHIQSSAKSVCFAASFLLVAPAVWYILSCLPPACYPYLITLSTSVIPVLCSTRAFYTRDSKSSVRWLSYWACAPVLDAVHLFVIQRWRPDSLDVQRLFIITVIWLQVWMGSRHVFHLLRVAFAGLKLVLPSNLAQALRVPGSATPSWQAILKFQRLASDLRDKKVALLLGSVFAIIVLTQVISAVSGLLSLGIWVGAALDSERTVRHQLVPMYRQKLSFWILATALELVVQVPLLGFWVAMWRPLILSVCLVQGENVLSTILFFLPKFSRRPVRPAIREEPDPQPALEFVPDAPPPPPPSYEAAVAAVKKRR